MDNATFRRFCIANGVALIDYSSGGLIDPRTNQSIDPYEYAWADFINLTASDFAGIYVVITDRFVDPRGVNRVRFVGGTEWSIDSPHMYCASLAAAPDPTVWNGLRVFLPIGLGGSIWVSNGTVYRPQASIITLACLSADINYSTTLTTEKLPSTIQLYRDVNNKSMMRDGDFLRVVRGVINKTGTSDKLIRHYRFGTNNSSADTALVSTTSTNATDVYRYDELIDWQRRSSISIKAIGAGNSTPFTGGIVTAPPSAVAVSDMDSANDSYFNIGVLLNGSVGDTAITMMGYTVELHKGAA